MDGSSFCKSGVRLMLCFSKYSCTLSFMCVPSTNMASVSKYPSSAAAFNTQRKAYQWGNSRLGYWRIAGSPDLKCSITNERLAAAGYFSILNYYESLHLCG